MTSEQIINKRNGFALCLIIAILLISMIGIAVGSIAKGAERNLEKVTYPTSFKLSQSDTAYSFSELTYIMKDKDKLHYFVMEPEYYYYHWAEIKMRIQYPEKEDPLVYWEDKSNFSYQEKYIHIYEDSSLTKEMNIKGYEFTDFAYYFDPNYTDINFKLGDILDLLDEHGDSQNYYIVIDPFITATTTHEGSPIVIEFKFKDTEYVTKRKTHSTTAEHSGLAFTTIDTDERDPVSRGIHVYQPSIYRAKTLSTRTTTRTVTTTKTTTRKTTKSAEISSTTKNSGGATTAHEHYWVSIYDGDAIVEDLSRFCQCPECGLRFKDRTLLESHAYSLGHKLSDDPADDVFSTGAAKKEVIVGYTNGTVEYVCKTCGASTKVPDSETVVPSSTKKTEEPSSKKTDEPSSKKSEESTTKKNEPKPVTTLNGLVQGPDGKWAMYKNGAVDTSTTGVFQNQYGWWRVEKGYVNFNAQGIYQNAYGWWKTANGKVTFKETGVFQNQFGWWRVKDSKVDFNANGIYQNKYGWWKTKGGKVDFSFTGIAKNEFGTWYVKGGKVDFSKNGNVTYNGKTYTVANGKVK